MLRNIVESKFSSNLTFILDGEDVSGGDLFRAFLINSTAIESFQQVHLVCLENPPKLYKNCLQWNKQIVLHNFFSDPCSWNGNFHSNLINFLTKFTDEFPKSLLYVDSLHALVVKLGFSTVYKFLHKLKSTTNIVCLIHEDLFKVDVLEKMLSLATACIYVKCAPELILNSNRNSKKLVDVIFKKLGGKICALTEIYRVDRNFKISSQTVNNISNSKINSIATRKEFDNLTTFELGLQMKDTEKRAKEQLVLPYTRVQQKNELQEKQNIIYNLESIDIEDDPDDDLNI